MSPLKNKSTQSQVSFSSSNKKRILCGGVSRVLQECNSNKTYE